MLSAWLVAIGVVHARCQAGAPPPPHPGAPPPGRPPWLRVHRVWLLALCLGALQAEAGPKAGRRALVGGAPTVIPALDSTTNDTGNNASNAVLWYGQSLAIGSQGTPALTTTSPWTNVYGANGATFPALIEPAPGASATSESGVAAALNGMRNLVGASKGWIGSTHGVSGLDLSEIAQGTSPYNNLITQVTNSYNNRATVGGAYRVDAIIMRHGEDDCLNYPSTGNANYATNLELLRINLQNDIRAITGTPLTPRHIPMFNWQMSSWMTSTLGSQPRCTVPDQIRQKALASYNKQHLIGPQYFLTYADSVHHDNAGYRLMGDYETMAMEHTLIDGDGPVIDNRGWQPLQPISATASGSTIRVCFYVPCSDLGTCGATQLNLDTTGVVCPGHTTGSGTCLHGFEITDACPQPRYLTAVAVDGSTNCVNLTMDGTVGAGCTSVSYARTGVPTAFAGTGAAANQTGAARGTLRDTNTITGYQSGATLSNWAVHFTSFPVSGGGGAASGVASLVDDVRYSWRYDSSTCPSAGAGWQGTVNGGSRTVPYSSGTWSCAGATTPAQSGAIGASRVGAALRPTRNAPGCWDESAAGITAWDIATSDDLLYEYVGELGRWSSAITIWQFRGDVATNNELYNQIQTDGRWTTQAQTAGGDIGLNQNNAVAQRPQLSVAWTVLEKTGADANSANMVVTSCINGTCTQSDATGSAGGATGTGSMSIGCNNTGGTTSRNPFTQISHSWLVGEMGRMRAQGGGGSAQLQAANLAAYQQLCPSGPTTPCYLAFDDEYYLAPTTGEWISSPNFASPDESGFTTIMRMRCTSTPALNTVFSGREPGGQLRNDFSAGQELRWRYYLSVTGGDAQQACWHTSDRIQVNTWQTIGLNVDETRDNGGDANAVRNQSILDFYLKNPADSYAALTDFDTCGTSLVDVGAAAAPFIVNHGTAGGTDGSTCQYRQMMFFDRALTAAEMRAVMQDDADPTRTASDPKGPLTDPQTGNTVDVSADLVFWYPVTGADTYNGTAGTGFDWSGRTECGGSACNFTGNLVDAADVTYSP